MKYIINKIKVNIIILMILDFLRDVYEIKTVD